MVNDLEERERALKKAKVEKEEKQRATWRENEKIMEEGRLMRQRREKDLFAREQATQKEESTRAEFEPPSLGTW